MKKKETNRKERGGTQVRNNEWKREINRKER